MKILTLMKDNKKVNVYSKKQTAGINMHGFILTISVLCIC